MEKKIIILLSIYNGEKYLKQQLDSLKNQTLKDFEIIARDDGSCDDSLDILEQYNCKILESKNNIGVKASFATLLEYALKNSEAEYFMFCDQDDVWNSDKVEKTHEKMQELKKIYGKDALLLVHTDLEVVNENLEILSPSLWKSEHINPKANTLNKLLMQNTITGCTIMINRSLAAKSLSISDKAIMHDWWIGLVASAFGKIGFIEESTMKYRQHAKNDTGAKNYNYKLIINKLKKFGDININKNIYQGREFLKEYRGLLDEKSKIMLDDFSTIKEKPYLKRVNIILKYRLLKYGMIRNIGLLLKI